MDATPDKVVVFSIHATGTESLSYLWECKIESRNAGWQSCDTEVQNSSKLTIPSVQKSNEGSYRCTVSNCAGSETSECATLTVGELQCHVLHWQTRAGASHWQFTTWLTEPAFHVVFIWCENIQLNCMDSAHNPKCLIWHSHALTHLLCNSAIQNQHCYHSEASPFLPFSLRSVYMVFMGRGFTLEGKSWGLCLVQLCAKYRLVSTTSSLYH